MAEEQSLSSLRLRRLAEALVLSLASLIVAPCYELYSVRYWLITIVLHLLALSSYSSSFAAQNPKRCKSSAILRILSQFPTTIIIPKPEFPTAVERQSSQSSGVFKLQIGQSGSKPLPSFPASINCCCDTTRLSWLRYCRCIITRPDRRLHLYVCGEICMCCVCCLDDTDQALLLACRGPSPSCGMSSGQTPTENWWESTSHEKRKTRCSRKTIKVSRDAVRHPQPARAGQVTPRLPFSAPEA